jgi:hypothetical protein
VSRNEEDDRMESEREREREEVKVRSCEVERGGE